MLKTKIIKHYKPPTKTIELLNSIPNIKLEIINGYAQIIEKVLTHHNTLKFRFNIFK